MDVRVSYCPCCHVATSIDKPEEEIQSKECALCGKPLITVDTCLETEYGVEHYTTFCSLQVPGVFYQVSTCKCGGLVHHHHMGDPTETRCPLCGSG